MRITACALNYMASKACKADQSNSLGSILFVPRASYNPQCFPHAYELPIFSNWKLFQEEVCICITPEIFKKLKSSFYFYH